MWGARTIARSSRAEERAGGQAEDIPEILVAPTEDVEKEGDSCSERRGSLVLLSAAVPGFGRVECREREGRRPRLAFKR